MSLSIMTAALGHDLEHPGTNNAFQVAIKSEVALRYNNLSVLENHHYACTEASLKNKDCGWLSYLDKPLQEVIRLVCRNTSSIPFAPPT